MNSTNLSVFQRIPLKSIINIIDNHTRLDHLKDEIYQAIVCVCEDDEDEQETDFDIEFPNTHLGPDFSTCIRSVFKEVWNGKISHTWYKGKRVYITNVWAGMMIQNKAQWVPVRSMCNYPSGIIRFRISFKLI